MLMPKQTPEQRAVTEALFERAREWDRTATPEQKQSMYQAQRESFIRAMAPCEHGCVDWETCPECLSRYRTDTPEKSNGA